MVFCCSQGKEGVSLCEHKCSSNLQLDFLFGEAGVSPIHLCFAFQSAKWSPNCAVSACLSIVQVEAGSDVSPALFRLSLEALRVGLHYTKNFWSLCRTDGEALSSVIKALTMNGLLHTNWSLSMSVIKYKYTHNDFWNAQVYLLSGTDSVISVRGMENWEVLAILVTECRTFMQSELTAIALILCNQNHFLKLCSYLLAGWSLWGCFKLCLACRLQSWVGGKLSWTLLGAPRALIGLAHESTEIIIVILPM